MVTQKWSPRGRQVDGKVRGGGTPRPCSPPAPQEGMLKDLQKSVEEEEQVWKARVSTTEEELQKVWAVPGLPRVRPPSEPRFRFIRSAAGSEFCEIQGGHR